MAKIQLSVNRIKESQQAENEGKSEKLPYLLIKGAQNKSTNEIKKIIPYVR